MWTNRYRYLDPFLSDLKFGRMTPAQRVRRATAAVKRLGTLIRRTKTAVQALNDALAPPT